MVSDPGVGAVTEAADASPSGAATGMPALAGEGATTAAAPEPGAAVKRVNSAIFLDNSAMRLAVALACFSLAIASSLIEAALP